MVSDIICLFFFPRSLSPFFLRLADADRRRPPPVAKFDDVLRPNTRLYLSACDGERDDEKDDRPDFLFCRAPIICSSPRNDLFLSLIREASARRSHSDRRGGWINATSLVDITGTSRFDETVRAHVLFGATTTTTTTTRDVDDEPSSSSAGGGVGSERSSIRRRRPDIDATAAASDGVIVVVVVAQETAGEEGAGRPSMMPWWRDEVEARWAGSGEAGGGGGDDDRRGRGATTSGGGRACRGSEMQMAVHYAFLWPWLSYHALSWHG